MSTLTKPNHPGVVTFAEQADGFGVWFDPTSGGWEVKKKFLVPYSQRWLFSRMLMGGAVVDPNDTTKVFRDTPCTFDIKLQNNKIPAASFVPLGIRRIGPHGTCLSRGVYTHADVEVDFGLPKFGTGPTGSLDESTGTRFVELSIETALGDSQTPPQYFKWIEQNNVGQDVLGDPICHPLKFYLPRGRMVLQWHLTPRAPLLDIQKTLGAVNSAAFLGWEAGRLLLVSAAISRQRWFDGNYLYTCTYYIQIQGAGLTLPSTVRSRAGLVTYDTRTRQDLTNNHFKRYGFGAGGIPTGIEYRLLTHDGRSTGTRVYDSQDYAKLLQPGPAHNLF